MPADDITIEECHLKPLKDPDEAWFKARNKRHPSWHEEKLALEQTYLHEERYGISKAFREVLMRIKCCSEQLQQDKEIPAAPRVFVSFAYASAHDVGFESLVLPSVRRLVEDLEHVGFVCHFCEDTYNELRSKVGGDVLKFMKIGVLKASDLVLIIGSETFQYKCLHKNWHGESHAVRKEYLYTLQKDINNLLSPPVHNLPQNPSVVFFAVISSTDSNTITHYRQEIERQCERLGQPITYNQELIELVKLTAPTPTEYNYYRNFELLVVRMYTSFFLSKCGEEPQELIDTCQKEFRDFGRDHPKKEFISQLTLGKFTVPKVQSIINSRHRKCVGWMCLAATLSAGGGSALFILALNSVEAPCQEQASEDVSDSLALLRDRRTTRLELTGRRINDALVVELATLVENNTDLRYLDLSNNEIGNQGAIALGRALGVNRALQYLDLSGNCIGSSGAEGLSEGLVGNPVVTNLGMMNNHIGDHGAQSFANMLDRNVALLALFLENNDISQEGVGYLVNALGRNNVLRYLGIESEGNSITDDQSQRLQQALDQNSQYPLFVNNRLHIQEGQRVTLSPNQLLATSGNRSVQFIISGLSNGMFTDEQFQSINSFNQSQVNQSYISFSHTGGDQAPSFNVSAFDGRLRTNPRPAVIFFQDVSHAPMLTRNAMVLRPHQSRQLTAALLRASDEDTADTQLFFMIESAQLAHFENQYGDRISRFTQAEVIDGHVRLVSESVVAPTIHFSITDSINRVGPFEMSIRFNPRGIRYTVVNISDEWLDGYNGHRFHGVEDVRYVGDLNGDGATDTSLLLDTGDNRILWETEGLLGLSSVDVDDLEAMSGTTFIAPPINGAISSRFSLTGSCGDVNGDNRDDVCFTYSADLELVRTYNVSDYGHGFIIFGDEGLTSVNEFNLSHLDRSQGVHITGLADEAIVSPMIAVDSNNNNASDIIVQTHGRVHNRESDLNHFRAYSIFDTSHQDELRNVFVSNGMSVLPPEYLLLDVYREQIYLMDSSDDVDGNGYDDLMACVILTSYEDDRADCFILFNDHTTGLGVRRHLSGPNTLMLLGSGDYPEHRHGGFISDINDDGYPEIAIIDPFARNYSGAVHIIFGNRRLRQRGVLDVQQLTGHDGFSVYGTEPFYRLGFGYGSVVSLDYNQDGIGDFACSDFSGRLYIIFGSATIGASGRVDLITLDGSNGVILNYLQSFDRHLARDMIYFNQDLVPDLSLSAENYSSNRWDADIFYGVSEQNCFVSINDIHVALSGSLLLSRQHINASCLSYPAENISLHVNNTLYGKFVLSQDGTQVNQFTQGDIDDGVVTLVSTDDNQFPSFEIYSEFAWWQTYPQIIQIEPPILPTMLVTHSTTVATVTASQSVMATLVASLTTLSTDAITTASIDATIQQNDSAIPASMEIGCHCIHQVDNEIWTLYSYALFSLSAFMFIVATVYAYNFVYAADRNGNKTKRLFGCLGLGLFCLNKQKPPRSEDIDVAIENGRHGQYPPAMHAHHHVLISAAGMSSAERSDHVGGQEDHRGSSRMVMSSQI